MELKPENKNTNPKYPDEDNINIKHLKKPLKRWQKLGITAAVLTSLGTAGYLYKEYIKYNNVEIAGNYVEISPILVFNAKFNNFPTSNLNKNQIRELINRALSSNNMDRTISINNISNSDEILEYSNSLPDDKTYSIEICYDSEGYIYNINIIKEQPIEEESNVSINKITKKDFIKKLQSLIDLYNHNGLA